MSTQHEGELAEALEQDPTGGSEERCWAALGRVGDEDPVYVFSDGASNGMTVTCRVLTGPFTGAEVVAMVSCPLGGGFESRPLKPGMRVLLQFLEGRVDGHVVAVANVPGGRENPIPTAIAGVAVDEGGLEKEQLVAPPKGTNIRFYVLGAAFLVRLKGNQEGYVGEFYVEGDDGDADGFNNTFIRLARNPNTGKLAIKLKTADGLELALDNGVGSMTSPNGKNTIQVSDNGSRILGDSLLIDVGTCIMNGVYLVNLPPGVPPNPLFAALRGTAGVSGLPSLGFFIGV